MEQTEKANHMARIYVYDILEDVIALARKKKAGDIDENGDLTPAFKSYLEQLSMLPADALQPLASGF